jgi:hypothetical protein
MAPVIGLIVKFLPAILALKDVTVAFKEERKEDKPFYLSQRFWGILITSIGGVVAVFFGVKLDPTTITSLSEGIVGLITIGITVYGTIMTAKGVIDKREREK